MFEPEEQDADMSKMHAKRVGRELAMQYLFECEMREELPSAAGFEAFFEQAALEFQLGENRTARKGRDYAEKLYVSVTVNKEEIDSTIRKRMENWDFDRIGVVDRNIMRIAVAEMLFDEDVPPVVSIDEAVEIARDYSGEDSGNFINGVLNGVKDTLKRSPRGNK